MSEGVFVFVWINWHRVLTAKLIEKGKTFWRANWPQLTAKFVLKGKEREGRGNEGGREG
jgi:hypothetical protein